MTMRPSEIAQTDNATDAFHAIYNDAEMMLCWLAQPDTLAAKMERAGQCLMVALDPCYRFRLVTVPQDVIDAIDAFLAECRRQAAPLAAELRTLRSEGLSWGECWGRSELAADLGFEPGDANLLGVMDATIDPALAARLAEGAR